MIAIGCDHAGVEMKKAIIAELSEKGFDRVDFSSLQQRAYEYICQKKDAGSVFKHVIVDEYQDTNKAQFKLISLLASKYGNITVVGDNDQGIYSFRGADITNIQMNLI